MTARTETQSFVRSEPEARLATASAPPPEIALGSFGLGLLLPLLAGGNMLLLVEPTSAVPVFLAVSFGFGALLIRRRDAAPAGASPLETAALLLLLVWWWGNLLLRPFGPRGILEAQGFLAAGMLFLLLSRRPLLEEELERFVLGLTAGTLVTALYAQYQHWFVFPSLTPVMIERYGRAPFLSVNANFYSANCYAPFLAATLFLLAGSAFGRKSRTPSPFVWLAVPSLLFTLVLTGSRATVAFLVGGGLLFFAAARLERRQRRIGAILLTIAIGLAVLFGWRWLDAQELWKNALLGRIDVWQGAFAMIRDHWFLGVGLGGFAEEFHTYRVTDYYTRYPHNLFLEVFAELGIVGVLALSAFLAAAFTASLRSVRSSGSLLRRHALAGAALLLAHAMVDIDWHAPANPILLMVLLAVSRPPRPEPGC